MTSMKRMKGVAHDLAHHSNSFFGYLDPHLSEACRAANVICAEVNLLADDPYPLGLPEVKPLGFALSSLRHWFWETVERNGFTHDNVKAVRIEFDLEADRADDYTYSVTAIITGSNNKVYRKKVF